MFTNIRTRKLGLISLSKYVVYHYKQQNDLDDKKSLELAVEVLQSDELERLHMPLSVNQALIEGNDDPYALEFWIHKTTSTIFTVITQSNGKHVEMAMKANIDDFIFD